MNQLNSQQNNIRSTLSPGDCCSLTYWQRMRKISKSTKRLYRNILKVRFADRISEICKPVNISYNVLSDKYTPPLFPGFYEFSFSRNSDSPFCNAAEFWT